jgi:uncharacterized membrane protein (UPF0127 family)
MKIFAGEKIIADDVQIAESMLLRFKGFMLRSYIGAGEGLLIPRCNWIHTLFMMQEIDAVYLNSESIIVDLQSNIKPWRICRPRFKAKSTLELCSGAIRSKSLKVGEVLKCSA